MGVDVDPTNTALGLPPSTATHSDALPLGLAALPQRSEIKLAGSTLNALPGRSSGRSCATAQDAEIAVGQAS